MGDCFTKLRHIHVVVAMILGDSIASTGYELKSRTLKESARCNTDLLYRHEHVECLGFAKAMPVQRQYRGLVVDHG